MKPEVGRLFLAAARGPVGEASQLHLRLPSIDKEAGLQAKSASLHLP